MPGVNKNNCPLPAFFRLVNCPMAHHAGRALFLGFFLSSVSGLHGQLSTDTPEPIRVTVSMNADGTRTTYEFDSPHRRATATTTGKDGKTLGRIRYVLDDAGRFASGEVYGPNDQFRFKTLYKYDAAGRLTQETQLGTDDSVRNKIIYAHDKAGRQTGYSVYDAAGKLMRKTPDVTPPPTPAGKRK
jgi:YD repeat-containing protein